METKNYLELKDLEAYKLAREYSQHAWTIYEILDWMKKKIFGDQMVRSIDSVGANIAEGYGRYHYLDKIKFYYNARGSLLEAQHWIDLINERRIIAQERHKYLTSLNQSILLKINGLIKSQYIRKSQP